MALNFLNGDDEFERAHAMHIAGRLMDAGPLYQAVLRTNPNHRWALHNLAAIAVQTGQPQAGIELLRHLLKLDPHNADAFNTLGEAYRGIGMPTEALQCFDKAIEFNPTFRPAYNNRGIVQATLGRSTDAMESWKKAIAVAGDSADSRKWQAVVHNNLGNACLERGEIGEAMEHHRRACEFDPNNPIYHSNLLRGLVHADDVPADTLRAAHVDWWHRHVAGITPMQQPPGGDAEKKLRIGMLSPDFREHSVAYFLTNLFKHYNRERFEFLCYSNSQISDAMTQQIAAKATRFRDIVTFTDERLVTLIRQDQIDVLVDLAGHTANHRLRVLAYKPAPVQVTYLGYPQTTGGRLVDWRITDPIADPPGMTDPHFVERLWRLPRCAWCYQSPVEIAAEETPPTLRGETLTFASFNNYSKVTDRMISLWGRILGAVPASRLLLKAVALRDENICEQARSRFASAGVHADRLVFSGKRNTMAEHLALYREVDLALDTFPYDGTTTTCEALWMNVPVITLEGATHASRVGVSLLSAVGLPELIAKNEDEYAAIAQRLATASNELMRIRTGLRRRLQQSPLMDGPGFARDFCEALRGMWREYVTR